MSAFGLKPHSNVLGYMHWLASRSPMSGIVRANQISLIESKLLRSGYTFLCNLP